MSTGIQSENGQISAVIDYLMERNNMTVTDLVPCTAYCNDGIAAKRTCIR